MPSFLRHANGFGIVGALIILADIAVWVGFGSSAALRTLAAAALLTLPGFALSYLTVPTLAVEGQADPVIDAIERTTLAVALSIVVVSAVVFVLAKFRQPSGEPALTPRVLTGALLVVTFALGAGATWRTRRLALPYALAIAAGVAVPFAAHWLGVPVSRRWLMADGLFALVCLAVAAAGTRIWRWAMERFPFVISFSRYVAVGASNTVIDFAMYAALTRGSTFWRAHYLLANAITFVTVVTWSFIWNKRWTFRDRSSRVFVQYLRFVFATLGGLVIAQLILGGGVRFLHLPDLLAKLIAGPFIVLWNYTAYRRWAFRSTHTRRAPVPGDP